MSASWQDNERLMDLLVKEALEPLTAEEAAELATLVQATPELDREAMQSTVAALWACASGKHEPMPRGLRERILGATPGKTSDKVVPFRAPAAVSTVQRRLSASAGWWAAAASFALAVLGWWPRLMHEPMTRSQLMAQGHVMQVNFTPMSQEPLSGDVVFDPVRQIGFLRFRGIPANDPRLAQYQLWIADAGRKQPEPVDGGVFDVKPRTDASGDVIIPFHTKLPVGKPAAFVVTMEQPGGVVVSKQERVIAMAKMPAGA